MQALFAQKSTGTKRKRPPYKEATTFHTRIIKSYQEYQEKLSPGLHSMYKENPTPSKWDGVYSLDKLEIKLQALPPGFQPQQQLPSQEPT